MSYQDELSALGIKADSEIEQLKRQLNVSEDHVVQLTEQVATILAEYEAYKVANPVTGPTAPSLAPFKFAVIPDSQQEVVGRTDTRFYDRCVWLTKQDVKFVVHTGDICNWDTDDHYQYAIAKKGTDALKAAGIPFSISIGNHDTMATGVGGSARDPQRTYTLQRQTQTFNTFWKIGDYGVPEASTGAFEPGKVDNIYQLFNINGVKILVLTLEFCVRPAALAWAKTVLAKFPEYNVFVNTHSYLNGSNGIDQSNQGYGDTSGQKLFNELVSVYPNVKMVFSGHTGYAAKARVDTGKAGNKIHSFLTTMHDGYNNPVRMFEVDPKAKTVKVTIYAPNINKTWTEYSETVTVDFI